MQSATTVVMTELFEKNFVERLSRSILHQKLSGTDQPNINKVNSVSVAFMDAMVKQVQAYKNVTIDNFRCFESGGMLIGALYDNAFLAYPENFGNPLVELEGFRGGFVVDGMSFGLITSMVVCRELSAKYEKEGAWDKVLPLLEAYFATHDAFLAAGRVIDMMGDAASLSEHISAHNLDIAFRTILRLQNKDGVSGTYDRLVKAREIAKKPTLGMRIRKILRVA